MTLTHTHTHTHTDTHRHTQTHTDTRERLSKTLFLTFLVLSALCSKAHLITDCCGNITHKSSVSTCKETDGDAGREEKCTKFERVKTATGGWYYFMVMKIEQCFFLFFLFSTPRIWEPEKARVGQFIHCTCSGWHGEYNVSWCQGTELR